MKDSTYIIFLTIAFIAITLIAVYWKAQYDKADEQIQFLTNNKLLIRICQFNRTNDLMGIKGEYEVPEEELYKLLDDWKQWEIE